MNMIARLINFIPWPRVRNVRPTANILPFKKPGLQYIPGDTVAIIEPGVRRNHWHVANVQHVRSLPDGSFVYMVASVYYNAGQLERVEVPA